MAPEHARPFIEARDLLLRLRTDYDTAVREFRWPAMERFNWALDYFDYLPANALALRCIGETEEQLSFGDLRIRSNQVANHLRNLGVQRGDRVLLLLPIVRQLFEAILALMKLGAVFSPSSMLLTEPNLVSRVRRGHVQHVIADASVTGKFSHVPGEYTRIAIGSIPGWHRFEDAYDATETLLPNGETRATDPLLMYFTSGTTAEPKLVMHSHEYPIGQLSTMYFAGFQPGDIQLGMASPGWAAYFYWLFAGWTAGTTIVAVAQPRFDAKKVLDILVYCGITVFGAPPTAWRMLVQEDMAAYPARVREALSGGEPLNPEIIDHVRRVWGVTIRDVYGQTETTSLVACSPNQVVMPGSMGRPMPGFNIKLLDENDVEADEGEISVVLNTRPLGLLQGYRQEEGTTFPILGPYYRTGDVARSDREGRLTFVGRVDDVFKSSGYRISPFEIESVLLEHEAVAEVAVVPSPDAQRLVVSKAFIKLAAGYQPSATVACDIFSKMRDRLAPYKRVRRIEFLEVLPQTISGKIKRAELRQQEASRSQNGIRAATEFWEKDFPELILHR